MTKSDGERIASLETLVEVLLQEQREMREEIKSLLSLRDKGMGAFWLAATLIGTGVVGTVFTFISWLKG